LLPQYINTTHWPDDNAPLLCWVSHHHQLLPISIVYAVWVTSKWEYWIGYFYWLSWNRV
jgi:hypothetical protein